MPSECGRRSRVRCRWQDAAGCSNIMVMAFRRTRARHVGCARLDILLARTLSPIGPGPWPACPAHYHRRCRPHDRHVVWHGSATASRPLQLAVMIVAWLALAGVGKLG